MLFRSKNGLVLADGSKTGTFKSFARECIQVMSSAAQLRSDPTWRRWTWLTQQNIEWDSAGILLSCLLSRPMDQDLTSQASSVLDAFFDSWQTAYSPAQEPRWQKLCQLRETLRRTTQQGATDGETGSEDVQWMDLGWLAEVDFGNDEPLQP